MDHLSRRDDPAILAHSDSQISSRFGVRSDSLRRNSKRFPKRGHSKRSNRKRNAVRRDTDSTISDLWPRGLYRRI
jgi:hypothetical protein